MDLGTAISNVNYLAVLVSGIVAMGIGWLWYSPVLFGKAWISEIKVTEEEMKKRNPAKSMFFAFLLTLVMAFNLAIFLPGQPNFNWGLIAGGLAGIGWVAVSFGINYLFEGRSVKLFLINGGYMAVIFIIMGGILGVWK